MSATVQATRPASLNRRRRVRQKVHAPAYASFSGVSKSEMLDLYEILDISEVGVAVQCAAPMKIDRQVGICLWISRKPRGPISATARVVWSDSAGRVGLSLPALTNSGSAPPATVAIPERHGGAANAASSAASASDRQSTPYSAPATPTRSLPPPLSKEKRSPWAPTSKPFSPWLLPALSLCFGLLARPLPLQQKRPPQMPEQMPETDAGIMICRASAGPSAPPVGATLQVGSGFSGECVRTGKMSRCDDTETDERVDRESCRALGIRSILAAPIRLGERVIGLLEVFSAQPIAFGENDSAVLQRFAEMILAAVDRTARAHDPPLRLLPLPNLLCAARQCSVCSRSRQRKRKRKRETHLAMRTTTKWAVFACLAPTSIC